MIMTQEDAITEAAKREKHKPHSLSHKVWEPVHNSVKGWHVALVDTALHAAQKKHDEAISKLRDAYRTGDLRGLIDAASDALLARCDAELAGIKEPS